METGNTPHICMDSTALEEFTIWKPTVHFHMAGASDVDFCIFLHINLKTWRKTHYRRKLFMWKLLELHSCIAIVVGRIQKLKAHLKLVCE